MKKILFGAVFLVSLIVIPIRTMGAVSINIGISLPPPIVFEAPPQVIVLPDSDDVYVDPDIADADLYFWNGWWWRFWEGRWYRSLYYDHGWAYYDAVPTFYFSVDPDWRVFYREHNWHGHNWRYDRIPNRELHQNWKGWHNDGYWQRHESWGVKGYQPQTKQQVQQQRQQRQQQYHQRPDVQQHQQWKQQQQRKPQAQKPQGQQHQGGPQHPQSKGKPAGGEVEQKK